MEVRTKDKVFLAFFLPAAMLCAYVHFWRMDASRERDALAASHETLVAVEDFPIEKRIREKRVEDAAKALEEEKAVARPAPSVIAEENAALAIREREAMRIFRDAGLVVMRSEAVEGQAGDERAGEALKAALPGFAPVRRRYTLDGTYPAVKRALDAFCRERMAVVAERLQMRNAGFARWTLDLWL